MASATLPSLSTSEHIRFGVAQFASLFAANVAYLLTFGPGWSGLAAFVVAALAIFVASEAIVRRWGRRHGRLLVTRKEWDDARQAAQQTWTLRPIQGFVFGFEVLGEFESHELGRAHGRWCGLRSRMGDVLSAAKQTEGPA